MGGEERRDGWREGGQENKRVGRRGVSWPGRRERNLLLPAGNSYGSDPLPSFPYLPRLEVKVRGNRRTLNVKREIQEECVISREK